METVLAFLVLVGILIWFHELGHFLFAKLFGVKVEVFSVALVLFYLKSSGERPNTGSRRFLLVAL